MCTIKAYKQDSDFKFTSYIRYQIKNTMRPYLNNKDLLNECYSLNVPLTNDESTDTELIEFVKDDTAHTKFEQVEQSDVCKIVDQAVALLSDEQQIVINAYYFDNKTLKDIADILGKSIECVRQIKRKAMVTLSRSKALRMLYIELYD